MKLLLLFAMAAPPQEDSSVSFLYNAIKSETDVVKMEYLVSKLEPKADATNEFLVNYSIAHLAETFAANGNVAKATTYIGHLKDSVWIENAVLPVVRELTEAGKITDAEKIITPFLSSAQEHPAQDAGRMISRVPRDEFNFAYGMILHKKGDDKQALRYMKPEIATHGPGYQLTYTLALINAGDREQAMAATRAYILQTGATDAAFKKCFKDASYYDAFLDSARMVKKEKARVKMSRYKTNEPAPDFSITDANGKQVSLASLKGKTVIIDFWATWCIPCVGSFPGMQRAVDHYRQDSNVVFMFVHTSERTSTALEDAKRLLKNKHYSFDLYMDLAPNAMAKAFKITALPTKIIIDTTGVIRFKNTGYVGEDEAVDEISAMVDMAHQ